MAAGAQIKDPAFILEAMQELVTSQEEFPIKVEGTKTLPYAAVLVSHDPAARLVVVKLVRPLPPALAEGALFEMVFATKDKRYEARIVFQGRAGYLLYRFEAPSWLLASDRRLWKRYPVRPRENFQVAGQDAEFPGHGLTGPLLNLSMGGLAFRVDRMLRLEDGMPVAPGAHLFQQGKVLPTLRVRGLPKGEVLEVRGHVVRIQEINSELRLGIQFAGLDETAKVMLARLLQTRDRPSGQSSSGFSAGTSRIEWPAGSPAQEPDLGEPQAEDGDGLAAEAAPGPELAGLETLRRMDRRSTRVLLVSPPGPDRERIAQCLEAAGFWRYEASPDLFAAHAQCKAAGSVPVRMLLVDLEPSRAEGLEAVGAVRHLEPLLRSFGEVPVAFVTREPDPMLGLLERPGLAALAQDPGEGAAGWPERLDGLLF